ncbi:MAG: cation transporter [Gammaproteobacteria bacterium]|nr:cation transporter [Gammaproteobacteria bacterium]
MPHHHDHQHDHEHHHHGHGHHSHALQKSAKLLFASLIITLGFAFVEAIAGYFSGSLALMSDAGHMLTDSTSLALGAIAAWIANKPMTRKLTYGFGRAEVLAALINGILMLVVIAGIVYAAIGRFQSPTHVEGGTVTLVAFVGLIINIVVIFILSRDSHNLNTRAALLHVIGDLLGSVAAMVSGIVIIFTGWMLIDPILSVGISVLILYSTIHVLGETLRVIMEGVPNHLQLEVIRKTIAETEGVSSIEDLHIWMVSSRQTALSAHVRIEDFNHWHAILDKLHERLHHEFSIDHVTIQPTSSATVVTHQNGKQPWSDPVSNTEGSLPK